MAAMKAAIVADVAERLVQWDAGGSVSGDRSRTASATAGWLTVRKYVHAGERVGVMRGGQHLDEVWAASALHVRRLPQVAVR
jgi:hypothetical protein